MHRHFRSQKIRRGICFCVFYVCMHAYLLTYKLIYISVDLPFYLSVCIPAYLSTHLSVYLSVCLLTYLPSYLPTYLPIYLSTYLPTYLWTCLLTYAPIYLLVKYIHMINSIYICISSLTTLLHLFIYLYKHVWYLEIDVHVEEVYIIIDSLLLSFSLPPQVSVFHKPCETEAQCVERRDALMQLIYASLFSHIVAFINTQVSAHRNLWSHFLGEFPMSWVYKSDLFVDFMFVCFFIIIFILYIDSFVSYDQMLCVL